LTRRLNDLKTNFEEEGIQVSYERDGKRRSIRISKIPSELSDCHVQERSYDDDTHDSLESSQLTLSDELSGKIQELADDDDDHDSKIPISLLSQRDRLLELRGRVGRLCENAGSLIAATDEIKKNVGDYPNLLDDLHEIKKAGFIYEPKPGFWRVV
jgi:hypothetical protein